MLISQISAFFSVAEKKARSVISGALLLLSSPRDLPRNLWLLARYLSNVQLRRKNLVVLVRGGGLGDLTCLLASVPGLKERHPNSWLAVISPPGCWRLAASTGLVDVTADMHSFFAVFVERACASSRYYRPWLPDEHDPPKPQVLHLADEFARAVGVSPDPFAVHLRIPSGARRRMLRRLREINPGQHPVVVFHPGPTWPVREWPSARWNALAELISARTPSVIIKVGTDLDSMRRVRPTAPIPNAVDWTNELDVTEIAALLDQASVFVGIDSGPLHIAGVLATPSVALFGPVSAKFRMHPRAQATVVTGGVSCLGCQHNPAGPLHWRTGCPHNIACMHEIRVEEVFKALAPYIER